MIIDAPDGRRIDVQRRGVSSVGPQVTLLDVGSTPLVLSVDGAMETGACLIAAAALADETLDRVDLPALILVARLELTRQALRQREQRRIRAASLGH